MKVFVVLLVAALALNGVLTLPAVNPKDDVEVIESDRAVDPNFKDFRGVIETESGYPFLQPNPQTFSFNLGFFDSFEDIFRRMLTRFSPSEYGGDGADKDDEGDIFGIRFDKKNGTTTSTVKIVGGTKIEVNETTYGDGENVFKVRTVNIHPVDSDEEGAQPEDNNPVGRPVTSAPRGASNGNTNNNEAEDDSGEKTEQPQMNPDDNEIREIFDDATVKY